MTDWRILSPLIIVGSAALFIALERRFPYDRSHALLRPGFWTDLIGYGLLQSYVLGLAINAIIAHLDAATGLSRLRLVSGWPILAQLAFFFVTHDLYIYCFHRLQHHNPVLWRIHEAHHAESQVDWIAGTRSHALEILINQTIEYAPIVLLGAHPDVVLMKGALDAVWGMYIHSNIGVQTGWLQRVINGPEMHRWHHAQDLERVGERNFATKLAVWDWLFGTAYLPKTRPRAYGLWGNAPFPEGFFAQQLFAFRRMKARPELPAGIAGGLQRRAS